MNSETETVLEKENPVSILAGLDPISPHRHMWLLRWGFYPICKHWHCGCFVVLRVSFTPESISLTQFESMWGTAERDNDVWQPVVSLLHAFTCFHGFAQLVRLSTICLGHRCPRVTEWRSICRVSSLWFRSQVSVLKGSSVKSLQ